MTWDARGRLWVVETELAKNPAKQQELLDKIDELAQPEDWWVMAGSLPPAVAEDFYARIVAERGERLHLRGMLQRMLKERREAELGTGRRRVLNLGRHRV